MKNIPNVGFICVGDTALELSGAICCAGKLMKIFKGSGYDIGGCYSCMCPSLQKSSLEEKLEHMCEINQLVVTVGGEGWRKSDVVPELTEKICTKSAHYFSHLLSCAYASDKCDGTGALKAESIDFTYSSRATAGFCGQALVLNLPSDPSYAVKRISSILPAVSFAVGAQSGFRPIKPENFMSKFGIGK